MSKETNTLNRQRALNTIEDVISSMQLDMHTKKIDDKEVMVMLGIYINRLVRRIQNAHDAITIERDDTDSLINQWVHR